MAEKRKRGQNFSLEDKDKLIKLLLQHKDTILNKKTDGSTNDAKNCAWISITNSYNSTSNTHRNKESLMKMWEKLKSDSKKYYAQIKNNTSQTGGGPLIINIDPVLEQVCAILGRGCTGVLGVPDCDAEPVSASQSDQDTENMYFKVICAQNELCQPVETLNIQTIAEPNNVKAGDEIPEKSQLQNIYECTDENVVEEPKINNIQELRKTPIKKTPLWSRRRPQISTINERNEATSSVSHSIQNLYKKRERVEELKEMLMKKELDFKTQLYELQLQAAAREVEIKTTILGQIKGGGFSLSNLFGVQNEKKD